MSESRRRREHAQTRRGNRKILLALARYYLALRLSASMTAPLVASAEWFASPPPIVRHYESRRHDMFDERELLRVGSQSLVVSRPLERDGRDRISLN